MFGREDVGIVGGGMKHKIGGGGGGEKKHKHLGLLKQWADVGGEGRGKSGWQQAIGGEKRGVEQFWSVRLPLPLSTFDCCCFLPTSTTEKHKNWGAEGHRRRNNPLINKCPHPRGGRRKTEFLGVKSRHFSPASPPHPNPSIGTPFSPPIGRMDQRMNECTLWKWKWMRKNYCLGM